VVSHATDLVEHAELVVDRLIAFADIVGQENVIAGTDCGLGGSVHPQIAAPSCAPRAMARRSRARSWEVEFKSARAEQVRERQEAARLRERIE
jgi:hypothetical protein